MRNKMTFFWAAAGAFVMGISLCAQQQEMTARDMFESAAGLLVPAPVKPAKASKSKTAKAAARTSPAAKTEQAKSPPAGKSSGAPAPAVTGGQGEMVPVSLRSGAAAPLGLRYSILRQVQGNQTEEVNADSTFHSGDRIRLSIQANDTAHLYIVQRGSSGNWSVLFPSPEIANGSNLIERGKQYEVPSGQWFAFDQQAGEEQLFIVLSRKPETDLENVIYSLRQGTKTSPAAPREQAGATILAENRPPIGDDLVSRVRAQVFARDLVFEKVDENTPGEKKEKAVYVVNKSGSADSRVVADVKLHHR